MEVNELLNCKNCGAILTASENQTIKCDYCGTIYHPKPQTDHTISSTEITTEGVQHQLENVENSDANETLQSDNFPTDKQNTNLGCSIALIASVVIMMVIFIAKIIGSEQKTTYSGSIAIDTSMLNTQPQPVELSETAQASLKKLAAIIVDKKLFKKLIKDSSNITTESAVQATYFRDKNSIVGKPVTGLYAYINCYDIAGCNIYFGCQHINKKPLGLQSLTFVINGKRLRYKSDFATDSLQHWINEYSEETIYDDKISILLKLVTADKVIVRFNGNKGHDQIILPKDQQDALKRQLQLYKGLLLGYAKE
ncbi:DNA-directed RNA polymerase subunit RPC12/RpoP [Mucilaginibacter sp. SG538B]|uniref:hypothetical protein n=1 Tax=Mucilaginibacter sp. SG538B TaxID=2587021 RepID=UPI00159D8806|nr:hypothetical protein [Mucilaginibacter sp. SG538B]NVM63326.1 DNA-directed RNA polymerase subunit RPC12/RpoP [Mucilaginibacter sp. SG538B]